MTIIERAEPRLVLRPYASSLPLGLLSFAVTLLAPTAVAVPLRPLLAAMLAISTLRAVAGGVYQLVGSSALSVTEGVLALLLALVAFYNGAAFLVEDALQRPVLPTGRRGPSHLALHGELADQLARTPHEAGVRHQL